MKKISSCSALALVALAVVDGQAIRDPTSPNPVVVSSRAKVIANLAQASIRVGDPLTLHFRLRVTSGVVKYVRGGFNNDYWVTVTEASGTELPRTEKGDRLRRRPTSLGPSISDALGPGQEEPDDTIDLSQLYRLDRPGSYFVRIARRIGIADPAHPSPVSADPKVVSQIPIEEAVSDLIPFTIIP